ncbi:hypothetical protein FA95DRAFT_1561082 [Auriscalpium vulgare]|uniref:Uncharacterized protein n=1 Tax=Auriscalpium vulgare TaxID=40419 RepID=A0ACB8RMN7_9AGAM|nr:hypothetical protein FA95DRAFT_1561082 [Auriscalpium vulgare]
MGPPSHPQYGVHVQQKMLDSNEGDWPMVEDHITYLPTGLTPTTAQCRHSAPASRADAGAQADVGAIGEHDPDVCEQHAVHSQVSSFAELEEIAQQLFI